jgi:predicted dehydrogenase
MDVCKIGIVGLGNAGQAIHVPVVSASKRAVLAGVFDPRNGFAKKYISHAKKQGLLSHTTRPVIFPSFRSMLDDTGIDAVVICTPHEFHVPMSMEALKTGKAVLCEKPICTSIPEAKEFLSHLESNGLENQFSLGYMWTRDPAVIALREMIDKCDHGFSPKPTSASQFSLTGNVDSWMGGFKPLKGRKSPLFQRVRPAAVTTPEERQAYEWFINVWSHASNLMQALFKTPVAISEARIWNGGNSFTWIEDYGTFKSINYFSWVIGKEFQRGLLVQYSDASFDLRFPPPIARAPGHLDITERGSTTTFVPPEHAKWAYEANFDLFLDLIGGGAGEEARQAHAAELRNAITDIRIAEAFIESAKKRQAISIEVDQP